MVYNIHISSFIVRKSQLSGMVFAHLKILVRKSDLQNFLYTCLQKHYLMDALF